MSPEPIFDYLRNMASTEHGAGILWLAFSAVFATSLLGLFSASLWTLKKSWLLACLSWRAISCILAACGQRPGDICRELLEALDDPLAAYNAEECELLAGGASFVLNARRTLEAVILGDDEELVVMADLTPFEVSLLNTRLETLVLRLRMAGERVKLTRTRHALRSRRERKA